MMEEIVEIEPLAPFERWYAEALANEQQPEAMTLATATRGGQPSARAVLLKGFDARGFVFYTNLESRKSTELFDNPQAALCLLWKSLRRQVRIEGTVKPVTDDEADAYFATRSRDSRIGAWASDQSRPLSSRAALEERFAMCARQYAAQPAVPRPANWSGFRIVPRRIEFWQEQPFRLHDRVVFVREGPRGEDMAWRKERLFP